MRSQMWPFSGYEPSCSLFFLLSGISEFGLLCNLQHLYLIFIWAPTCCWRRRGDGLVLQPSFFDVLK